MGVNKLISIKVPVMNALQDMGIDISKDVPVFTRWAVEAERNAIASYYSLKRKRYIATVSGCTVDVPCEVSFVQGVVLGDHGCDCEELFTRCFAGIVVTAMSEDSTFLVIDANGETNPTFSKIKWNVRQGKIVFNENLDGQKVTFQCLVVENDMEGWPMVMENHVMAIVEYIMYKYAVRSRFSPNKMDHGDVQRLWREWMRLASEARATDAELSESDRNEIIAMIHDPYIGYGMEVGMFERGELR